MGKWAMYRRRGGGGGPYAVPPPVPVAELLVNRQGSNDGSSNITPTFPGHASPFIATAAWTVLSLKWLVKLDVAGVGLVRADVWAGGGSLPVSLLGSSDLIPANDLPGTYTLVEWPGLLVGPLTPGTQYWGALFLVGAGDVSIRSSFTVGAPKRIDSFSGGAWSTATTNFGHSFEVWGTP